MAWKRLAKAALLLGSYLFVGAALVALWFGDYARATFLVVFAIWMAGKE
jgi:hypothetical protein